MLEIESLIRPILDIICDHVELGRAERDLLLEHQARLLAIHWRQKASLEFAQKDLRKKPRFGKDSGLAMQSEMTRLQVTADDISRARKVVISRAGMPPEVPVLGKIAVDMEMIEAPLLDALVVVQTGAYMLRTASGIEGAAGAEKIDPALLVALIEEKTDPAQFARNFIGAYDDDSPVTVAAQAFLHILDLALAVMRVVPALADAGIRESFYEVAQQVGCQTILTGAGMLADQGHLSDARDILMAAPDVEFKVTAAALKGFETLLRDGLKVCAEEGIILAQTYEKSQALLEKRLEQGDVGAIVSAAAAGKQDLDLREILRQRLKAAK